MSNTQDAIAAFLAKGGKVNKVADNASNGMSDRQWYRAARDIEPVKVLPTEQDDIDEALVERRFEIGAGFGVNGLNDFNDGVRKHGAKAMLGWK